GYKRRDDEEGSLESKLKSTDKRYQPDECEDHRGEQVAAERSSDKPFSWQGRQKEQPTKYRGSSQQQVQDNHSWVGHSTLHRFISPAVMFCAPPRGVCHEDARMGPAGPHPSAWLPDHPLE